MSDSTQTLDSKVFFSIPRTDLNNDNYRLWIDEELIPQWIIEKGDCTSWNERNNRWNEEGGISINFNKLGLFLWCKFYKFDDVGYFSFKRGVMFRDHYSEENVKKIKLISDCFEEFLLEKKVEYVRENFYRRNEP